MGAGNWDPPPEDTDRHDYEAWQAVTSGRIRAVMMVLAVLGAVVLGAVIVRVLW